MGATVQLNNSTYLSAKEAGRISGYTSDYIARLARQGKVEATRVGTQWFVEPKSLENFLQFAEQAKEVRKEQLRVERLNERDSAVSITSGVVAPGANTLVKAPSALSHADEVSSYHPAESLRAHATSFVTIGTGVMLAILFASPVVWSAVPTSTDVLYGARMVAFGFYHSLSDSSVVSQPAALVGAEGDTRESEPFTPQRTVNGAIAILPGDTASATVQYVKDSFSDDVEVSLEDDGSTGVVTPVFADGKGDAYRFVIVPLSSTPP